MELSLSAGLGGPGSGRASLQAQLNAFAERFQALLSGLQRQCEAEKKRIAHIERKLEVQLKDVRENTQEVGGRERLAELQGSVKGLMEETQALARRVEGLDERVFARKNGDEAARQKQRELEQQVQLLDQQSRLQASMNEETHKRQATKLCRIEESVKEIGKRLTKSEEMRVQYGSQIQEQLELRVAELEHHQMGLTTEVQSIQGQLGQESFGETPRLTNGEDGAYKIEEVLQGAQSSMAALEKKCLGQVEELASSMASLRVKSDSYCNRVDALADRLETSYSQSVESIRSDWAQTRTQERRELDAELNALRGKVDKVMESNEETLAKLHTSMQQAAPPPLEADPAWAALQERTDANVRNLMDLRARIEVLQVPAGAAENGAPVATDSEQEQREFEDLHRRIEWLEEQGAVVAATDRLDHQKVAQMQNTICELVEQVSRVSQRVSSGEATSSVLQQQLVQLQGFAESRQVNHVSEPLHWETTARLAAMLEQLTDLSARIVEIEGHLELARERGQDATLLVGCEAEASHNNNGGTRVRLQETLEAVATQLEVVDELVDRVGEVERRVGIGISPRGGSARNHNHGGVQAECGSRLSSAVDGVCTPEEARGDKASPPEVWESP